MCQNHLQVGEHSSSCSPTTPTVGQWALVVEDEVAEVLVDTNHRATDPLCSPAGGVGQVDVVEDQPRDARVASRTLGAQLPVH